MVCPYNCNGWFTGPTRSFDSTFWDLHLLFKKERTLLCKQTQAFVIITPCAEMLLLNWHIWSVQFLIPVKHYTHNLLG